MLTANVARARTNAKHEKDKAREQARINECHNLIDRRIQTAADDGLCEVVLSEAQLQEKYGQEAVYALLRALIDNGFRIRDCGLTDENGNRDRVVSW